MRSHESGLRTQHLSGMATMSSWVNNKTADFCGDYPTKSALNNPKSRPIIRGVLAVATMVGMILAIFFMESVEYRTVRKWDTQFLLEKNAWTLNYSKTTCPCKTPFIPWPLFVHFYWIDQALHRYNISNNTQFCDPLNNTGTSPQQLWKKGCYDMGFGGFDVNGSRLTVPSTTLLTPESLSYHISSSFRGYLDHEFSKYEVLVVNYSRDWLQLRWVNDILQNTAARPLMLEARRYVGNQYLTDQMFWNHMANFDLFDPRVEVTTMNGTMGGWVMKALDLTGRRAVSIEMNWTSYAQWCNPLYCDTVEQNSKLRRFLVTTGEVGGFSAIILLLIRCFVWPLLRHAFCFHDSTL